LARDSFSPLENHDSFPASATEPWSEEVHDLLREIAQRHLRREGQAITLQPTDLVHEAYLRLAGLTMKFENLQHFVRMSSTLMRRVLVDHARKKNREKRGQRPIRVTLKTCDMSDQDSGLQVIELDLLLTSLAKADPRKAKIAEVYYFVGLTQEETAEALELSPATVVRELRFIKSWIHAQLSPEASAGSLGIAPA
jgi:RNA polymerase sigma factor (TIGR02999 family)